jgi:hypothetical protein
MRSNGYAKLALVGVAAAVAVLGLTQMGSKKSMMSLQQTDSVYAKYLAKYRKSYGTKAEYEARREIFEKTLSEIFEHNMQNGGSTWTLGLNKFADMTDAEKQNHLGAMPPMAGEEGSEFELTELKLPSGKILFDWTSYMTPVRDQG